MVRYLPFRAFRVPKFPLTNETNWGHHLKNNGNCGPSQFDNGIFGGWESTKHVMAIMAIVEPCWTMLKYIMLTLKNSN